MTCYKAQESRQVIKYLVMKYMLIIEFRDIINHGHCSHPLDSHREGGFGGSFILSEWIV